MIFMVVMVQVKTAQSLVCGPAASTIVLRESGISATRLVFYACGS